MAALSLFSLAAGPTPFATAYDQFWGDTYNAHDWSKLQKLYDNGCEIVFNAAEQGFVFGNASGDFFKNSGLIDVSLEATQTYAESDSLVHNVGLLTHSAGSFNYYERMVKEGPNWYLATDMFPIGAATGSMPPRPPPVPNRGAGLLHPSVDPVSVATAVDEIWGQTYNAADWDKLTSLYHPDAIIVPDAASAGFAFGKGAGDFFKGAGLKEVTLIPQQTYMENDALIHNVGLLTHSAGSFKYYERLILVGNDWLLATDIFPIGA